jgi:hypothetical protein
MLAAREELEYRAVEAAVAASCPTRAGPLWTDTLPADLAPLHELLSNAADLDQRNVRTVSDRLEDIQGEVLVEQWQKLKSAELRLRAKVMKRAESAWRATLDTNYVAKAELTRYCPPRRPTRFFTLVY